MVINPADGRQEQDGSFDSYDPVVGKWMTNLVATTPITTKANEKYILLSWTDKRELKRTYGRRYKDLPGNSCNNNWYPCNNFHALSP